MSVLDGISAADSDGNTVDLGAVYGNVPAVLVVNVASKCGLTSSNYTWLGSNPRTLQASKYTITRIRVIYAKRSCLTLSEDTPAPDGYCSL
mmetsp:Transcript_51955/g.123766  ORF Transcript_51955/g.123766 Transcript_51955/m.123766 type:complete len:91 (-) Transcript_51955:571-843(-)